MKVSDLVSRSGGSEDEAGREIGPGGDGGLFGGEDGPPFFLHASLPLCFLGHFFGGFSFPLNPKQFPDLADSGR